MGPPELPPQAGWQTSSPSSQSPYGSGAEHSYTPVPDLHPHKTWPPPEMTVCVSDATLIQESSGWGNRCHNSHIPRCCAWVHLILCLGAPWVPQACECPSPGIDKAQKIIPVDFTFLPSHSPFYWGGTFCKKKKNGLVLFYWFNGGLLGIILETLRGNWKGCLLTNVAGVMVTFSSLE